MTPEQDRKWKTPELIALVRSTAEEAMLSPCKWQRCNSLPRLTGEMSGPVMRDVFLNRTYRVSQVLAIQRIHKRNERSQSLQCTNYELLPT